MLICACFTCRGGSRGAPPLTNLKEKVGPQKKDLHGRGGRVGEGVGGSICRVLRGSEALGGSFVRVLRGSGALGGRPSDEPMISGMPAKERPSRAWGEGEGRSSF